MKGNVSLGALVRFYSQVDDRMKVHFGSVAKDEDLLIDFDTMKNDYNRLERINPRYRFLQEHKHKDITVGEFEDMAQKMIDKTKEQRYHKFDFN